MSEKLLEMRHFRVLLYPEEPELAPPGPPESFGMGKMRKTALKEAVGCIIDGGQEAKTEILDYRIILMYKICSTLSATKTTAFSLLALVAMNAFAPRCLRAVDPPPAFEVISIKPTAPDSNHYAVYECDTARFVSRAFPISAVIEWSYGFKADRVFGLPTWAKDPAFAYDIEAKAAVPVDQEQCRLMGQSLLAERLNLKQHIEARKVRVFELIALDDGRKLSLIATQGAAKRATVNGQAVDADSLPGVTMSRLATILGGHPAVGGSVIDKTHLDGRYVFHLNFLEREGDSSDRPSVFTALKEQLGLQLRITTALLDCLVVDHIEKPSKN